MSYVEALSKARPATHIKMTGNANGIPSLRIVGAPGTYEIQASTDLSDWSPLATVSAPGGTADYLDTSAAKPMGRYYRAAQ